MGVFDSVDDIMSGKFPFCVLTRIQTKELLLSTNFIMELKSADNIYTFRN